MLKLIKTLGLTGGVLLLGGCNAPTGTQPDQTHFTEAGYACSPHLGISFVRHCQTWETTHEGQRQADQGDGTYLNPILSGDRPDPTIIKDGDDYYMTYSTFESYPALTIWHSRDLVNWQPVGPALTEYIGSIWAPELTLHNGRYYLYIPAKYPGNNNVYVVYADDIEGPWSDPIALGNDRIDPGHIVGEDGNRYLFLSHGDRALLSDDGLEILEVTNHTFNPWRYPDDWDVECYCEEGPKLMKRGDYYHMILAIGGTAGPPTGHMVVHSRSKSIHGPWEPSPHNPIARTESALEKWWSVGHATLIEGPTEGDWYMMYHGYENGFHTLGRQTIMSPVEWTDDDWLVRQDYDLSKPIPKPAGGDIVPHGMALSDDFTTNKFGIQWSFFRGGRDENERVSYDHDQGVLSLEAKGDSPSNTSPLTFVAGDQAYQVDVDIDFDEGAQGGVLLFYNDRLYAGLGISSENLHLHRHGQDRYEGKRANPGGNRVRIRVTNNRHIMSMHYSFDGGESWIKYDRQLDVSGYNHNVGHGFHSLKPAIYASGEGRVRFSNLVYRALP
ncbi:family 43 glycosylhydrolase [Marinimicrobium alkaliphilum]|uniref:family 43 glycosylhydrolase n=1 Tax=Marinimicrobium alkaliphilum TaxID=2202654 RepID=UPI000DB92FCD|nr:family 43 glycosylhydrolase [Marinimicrobium alkaliphilum]